VGNLTGWVRQLDLAPSFLPIFIILPLPLYYLKIVQRGSWHLSVKYPFFCKYCHIGRVLTINYKLCVLFKQNCMRPRAISRFWTETAILACSRNNGPHQHYSEQIYTAPCFSSNLLPPCFINTDLSFSLIFPNQSHLV
jgi:hypothetical protein